MKVGYVYWDSLVGGVLELSVALVRESVKIDFLPAPWHSKSFFKSLIRQYLFLKRSSCHHDLVVHQSLKLFLLSMFLFRRGKIALHLHNSLDYENFISRFFYRLISLFPVSIYLVSNGLREDFPLFSLAKYYFLPPIFRPFDDLDVDKRALIPKGKINIVICGRRHPHKGIDDFYNWWVLNNNLYEDFSISLFTNDIACLPSIPGLIVYEFDRLLYKKILLSSHFFFSLSKSEGYGLVLLEAMSCGCVPINLNLSSGPVEILNNYQSKLLYSSNGSIENLFTISSGIYSDTLLFFEISDWCKRRFFDLYTLNLLLWKRLESNALLPIDRIS